MKENISQEYIKELLSYDKDTGIFIWKKDRRGVIPGTIAGSYNSYGYRQIIIYGTNYLAHRLAWLHEYGEFPKGQIDHINRVKDDNCIKNLRVVNNQENSRNKGLQSNNKSGHQGVSWSKRHNKWMARIGIGKEAADKLGLKTSHKYLGLFADFDEAVCEYIKARDIYH